MERGLGENRRRLCLQLRQSLLSHVKLIVFSSAKTCCLWLKHHTVTLIFELVVYTVHRRGQICIDNTMDCFGKHFSSGQRLL